MDKIPLKIGEKDGREFTIDAEEFLTGRAAIIGMSGSGKSHLVGVLCEELSENRLPFIIIDPEGEYFSLKERYNIVWASNSKESDVPLDIDMIEGLIKETVKRMGRLIIDTSESSDEFEVVSRVMDTLYKIETELRIPTILIVEEADRFAPQSGGDSVSALYEISRRGRKRGIGMVVVTQRPAMVDKNILSQCGNQLIGRLRTENDLKAVKMFFSTSEEKNALPNLETGDFFVMGDISMTPQKIKVRERITRDVGSTPSLGTKNDFSIENIVKSAAKNPKRAVEESRSTNILKDGDATKEEAVVHTVKDEKEKVAEPIPLAHEESIMLEHFIYGPVPKKGYAIRAESDKADAAGYKEIFHGYFVPIDPVFLKDYSCESRMIVSVPQLDKILFSRIFKRGRLDDKGRGGILNHTLIVPRAAFEKGLSYKMLDEVMLDFERENGIPVGKMPTIELKYSSKRNDEDIEDINNIISKRSMEKIIKAIQKDRKSKVFLVAKNSTHEIRRKVAYAVSKVVEIQLNLAPLRILTDPPLPLILDNFPNVVVSGKMVHLKPNRGWVVTPTFKGEAEVYNPVEQKKVDNTLRNLYRN